MQGRIGKADNRILATQDLQGLLRDSTFEVALQRSSLSNGNIGARVIRTGFRFHNTVLTIH